MELDVIKDKVRDILWSYQAKSKTSRGAFYLIPRGVLKELIRYLEFICDYGPVGSNVCNSCGHIHNDSTYDYSFFLMLLDRARQTLVGIWINKCVHGRIISI